MSIFVHDGALWKTRAGSEHDNEWSAGFHLYQPQPPNLQVESRYFKPVKLEEYANAIQIKGGALDNCFGFIDGTVRPISRPGKNQRIVYDGHKRVHALKFQSLAPPNGLIANMYGPVGEYVNEILPVYTDECLHLYSVICLGGFRAWLRGPLPHLHVWNFVLLLTYSQ